MQNPMLQALAKNNPTINNLNQIRSMLNMVQSASNPQAMLQSLAQSNPQVKQVMDLVDQSGGDPKAAFYKMAEEKGVDPDQILSALK